MVYSLTIIIILLCFQFIHLDTATFLSTLGYFEYVHVFENQTIVFEKEMIKIKSHSDYRDSNTKTLSYENFKSSVYSIIKTGVIDEEKIFLAYVTKDIDILEAHVVIKSFSLSLSEYSDIEIKGIQGAFISLVRVQNLFLIFTLNSNKLLVHSILYANKEVTLDIEKNFQAMRCTSFSEKEIVCIGKTVEDNQLLAYSGNGENLSRIGKVLGKTEDDFEVTVGIENKIYVCSFGDEINCFYFSIDSPDEVSNIVLRIKCVSKKHFIRPLLSQTLFIGCANSYTYLGVNKVFISGESLIYNYLGYSSIGSGTQFDIAIYGVQDYILYYYKTDGIKTLVNHSTQVERNINIHVPKEGTFKLDFLKTIEVKDVFKDIEFSIRTNTDYIKIFDYEKFTRITENHINTPEKTFVYEKHIFDKVITFNYIIADTKASLAVILHLDFDCDPSCLTCFAAKNETSHNCLSCSSPLFLSNKDCVEKCPSNTEEKDGKCISCESQGKFFFNGHCLDKCSEGLFLYQNACVEECPIYTIQSSEGICKFCPDGLMLKDSTECVSEIPEGYFILGTYETHKVLGKCFSLCASCDSQGTLGYHKCTACKSDYFFYNGNCINSCKDFLIAEGSNSDEEMNQCRNCEEGLKFVNSENHLCYKEISKGYYINISNSKPFLLQKCPFKCSLADNPKEKEEFCENSKIFHNCYSNEKPDIDIDINTDIIKNNTQIIKDYVNSTEDEKIEILKKASQNLTEKIADNIIDGLQQSILLNQLLKETKNETEIKKYHDENLNQLEKFLTCEKIQELFINDPDKNLLMPSLSLYYSISNKELYFTEQQLKNVQTMSMCIIENGKDALGKVDDELSTDFFSVSASSTNKMINIFNQIPKKDSQFNEEQFVQNKTYKYSKSILENSLAKETKNLVEAVVKISSSFEEPIKYENFESIAISLKQLKKENYFKDNLVVSSSRCNEKDKIIYQVQNLKFQMKICLPIDTILEKYPEASYINIVKYKSYPLLNPNATDDISEKFNSITIRDEDANEIKIKDLTTPIKMIIKKFDVNFNSCIFYDEYRDSLNSSDCYSEILDQDFIICTCNHLTDFSLSKYDPIKLVKDMLKLFTQARFITSFDAFSILNVKNALVLYVISGILFVYLVLLGFVIAYDFKTHSDFFILMIKNGNDSCCDNEEKEEEFEELEDKITNWLPPQYLVEEENFDEFSPQEIELQTIQTDMSDIEKSFTQEVASKETVIPPLNKSLTRSSTKSSRKVPNNSFGSLTRMHYILFREFFKKEYWLCTFFNGEREMTKMNVLTIFIVHLIASMAVCSIFAECGIEDEIAQTTFNNRDFAVSIATILVLEIPFTFFEVMLCKTKVQSQNAPLVSKYRVNAIFRYIIMYIILAGIVVFSIINTTWISLDSEKNKLGCRFLTDFFMSAVFDCFIYQFIILFIKALIYVFLLKGNKSSCLRASLFCFVSSLPWIFNL